MTAESTVESAVKEFPFAAYFGHSLAQADSLTDQLAILDEYWQQLEALFRSVEELEFLDVLKSNHDCAGYLMTKGARLIAITANHAIKQVSSCSL
jgi:hypothetical protein